VVLPGAGRTTEASLVWSGLVGGHRPDPALLSKAGRRTLCPSSTNGTVRVPDRVRGRRRDAAATRRTSGQRLRGAEPARPGVRPDESTSRLLLDRFCQPTALLAGTPTSFVLTSRSSTTCSRACPLRTCAGSSPPCARSAPSGASPTQRPRCSSPTRLSHGTSTGSGRGHRPVPVPRHRRVPFGPLSPPAQRRSSRRHRCSLNRLRVLDPARHRVVRQRALRPRPGAPTVAAPPV